MKAYQNGLDALARARRSAPTVVAGDDPKPWTWKMTLAVIGGVAFVGVACSGWYKTWSAE